ncbi:hypothetical protein KM043_011524 [Ampulex compressa]|nr:hypothetical protein KM043_011524 [Ampulex compressa]
MHEPRGITAITAHKGRRGLPDITGVIYRRLTSVLSIAPRIQWLAGVAVIKSTPRNLATICFSHTMAIIGLGADRAGVRLSIPPLPSMASFAPIEARRKDPTGEKGASRDEFTLRLANISFGKSTGV